MTTETTNTAEAARALKARHRAMWAFGDYPAVATDLVAPLGPVLVGAVRDQARGPGARRGRRIRERRDPRRRGRSAAWWPAT